MKHDELIEQHEELGLEYARVLGLLEDAGISEQYGTAEWFNGDGTSERLPIDEWVERRKQAATALREQADEIVRLQADLLAAAESAVESNAEIEWLKNKYDNDRQLWESRYNGACEDATAAESSLAALREALQRMRDTIQPVRPRPMLPANVGLYQVPITMNDYAALFATPEAAEAEGGS